MSRLFNTSMYYQCVPVGNNMTQADMDRMYCTIIMNQSDSVKMKALIDKWLDKESGTWITTPETARKSGVKMVKVTFGRDLTQILRTDIGDKDKKAIALFKKIDKMVETQHPPPKDPSILHSRTLICI